MNKIYISPEIAQERIDLIKEQEKDSPSYTDLLFGKNYRYATWCGITLAVFNQLTGINIIVFYSNMLFRGLDISTNVITCTIGVVGLLSVIGGMILMIWLPRKVQLITFNLLLAIDLLVLTGFWF